MFCDGCDKEPVIHEVIKDPVSGELVEHHYCADCPAAKGISGASVPTLSHVVAQAISVSVSAAGDEAASTTPASAETTSCPGCGLDYGAFRQSGLLGCPDCYTAFEKKLGPLIARAHDGATHHVGKVPKRALAAASDRAEDENVLGSAYERAQRLTTLRKHIDDAVRSEHYERAAALRDELEALKRMTEGEDHA